MWFLGVIENTPVGPMTRWSMSVEPFPTGTAWSTVKAGPRRSSSAATRRSPRAPLNQERGGLRDGIDAQNVPHASESVPRNWSGDHSCMTA